MIPLIELFLVLSLGLVFVLLYLSLRRSPTFTAACETLADDDAANVIADLTKAERNVDREIVLTEKKITKHKKVADILAEARKEKT